MTTCGFLRIVPRISLVFTRTLAHTPPYQERFMVDIIHLFRPYQAFIVTLRQMHRGTCVGCAVGGVTVPAPRGYGGVGFCLLSV